MSITTFVPTNIYIIRITYKKKGLNCGYSQKKAKFNFMVSHSNLLMQRPKAAKNIIYRNIPFNTNEINLGEYLIKPVILLVKFMIILSRGN